jgi:NADPH:quinone reductase-like Zn-dependent oxidoreductase
VKAIVQTNYGLPDVLALKEIDRPAVEDDGVLVRVHAAALHAGDYFTMRGQPFAARLVVGLRKPNENYVPGFDVAGRVEAVGKNVTHFAPGDEVFGAYDGACAEYLAAAEDRFVHKPARLTFEQAAAIPTSAVAALRGLRDVGKVQPGQKVLINGASGGVGTFAVQIARAMGADVTGVCSTRNVELVRSIGAEHVVDYTREDFTADTRRYDLILDNVGNHSFAECRRVLTPDGVLVPNTGHAGMGYVVAALVRSLFTRQQGRLFVAVPKRDTLLVLQDLVESGKLTPVIDRTYPLSDTPEAFRYLEKGHARGKVVISIIGG